MVEIIPKPTKKELPATGFLFYLSILFLAVTLVVYFVFLSLQKRSEIALQEIQDQLQKGKTDEIRSLETEIKSYERKIKDIDPLLKEHILASKFFQELEEKTHPKVFFQQINLDLAKLTISLNGQTDNFFTLGQQILNLEENPLISELKLEQLSISKEGRIEFTLKFNFSPKIIK
jgi:Tfp pilus assembly protein PilN